MAKRRIHLTEGQLHRLIEQSINEISTETKMSAANKAARQARSYKEQGKDRNNSQLMRDYAKNMAKRRARQMDTFIKGVNNDVEKEYEVDRANFYPSNDNFFPDRGSLTLREPTCYSMASPHPVFGRSQYQDYLQGNSYYKNGKWMRPDDKGYDIEKSEWWSNIRDKNESIAHRVTENVIRLLKESYEDMNTFTRMVYDKLNGCFALGGQGYNPRTQTLNLRTSTAGGGTFHIKLPTYLDIDAVAMFNFGEKGELPSVEFAIKKMSPPQYARSVNKKQVVAELTNLYRRSETFLLRALYRISKHNSNFPSLEELGLELPQ